MLRYLFRRSFHDDESPLVASFRSQINNPVGHGDYVKIVLDDHDGLTPLDQPIEHHEQVAYVGRVQTGRRLI